MPILDKIVIKDFRNIELEELAFSPNINCISGNNGEGKTNLLDAIYYLSMTKSAFTPSDKFNIRHQMNEFSISGTYKMENGLSSKVSVSSSLEGVKKIKRDDKLYSKVSEHIGAFPIVIVSPFDTSLVADSSEERRRFVNSVLSQMSSDYLTSIQQFNRLLQQRNIILKNDKPHREYLSVLDYKMSQFAEKVCSYRLEFVEKLSPLVESYYRSLSGGEEKICIKYKSDILSFYNAKNTENEACNSISEAYVRLLNKNFEKDCILHYTSTGVQRDDFIFEIEDYPIRRCGSQGQQKSFLVALKFAQYEIMKNSYSFAPILLLDDVFDKLDMERIANLLKMVSSRDFGQIFITDSNKIRMETIVNALTDDRAYFETVSGKYELQ